MEQKKKAKAIMIQGTMSNAGKSLIAAGLCRIFRQDGYKVAPFKSQNMALNSFITDEGLEMGRAQVVQAEAAGIKPSVLMNPILLKPTTDVGSQVIINGKVSSNMTAREYYRHKKALIPVVKEAYEKLASEYDIIVIEGAGSPAEINLRNDDIVNMGMAELADAPVLLVGDIDRGGVFAQLYGTIALLEEQEQARIKGLIINKFRGDKTILDPGLDILKEKTGKEVLGVVPYMDVMIDDEDSLSERLNVQRSPITASKTGGNRESCNDRDKAVKSVGNCHDDIESYFSDSIIDIAVIRLPRISNFTDFTALSMESGVSLRYVSNVRELGEPDVIIIPGTKSTIRDMEWLRAMGLEAKLMQKFHKGTLIIGICGGYQMLGEKIIDRVGAETLVTENEVPENTVISENHMPKDSLKRPDGSGTETERTEADDLYRKKGTEVRGLGFLSVTTEFSEEKTRTGVTFELQGLSGEFETLNGKTVTGYEIHMGKTRNLAASNSLHADVSRHDRTESIDIDVKPDLRNGLFACCGNVLGTYVHGFFDSDELRKSFLDMLYRKKGIDPDKMELSERSYEDFKEAQYDKLASILRDSLDMEKIYSMIQESCN